MCYPLFNVYVKINDCKPTIKQMFIIRKYSNVKLDMKELKEELSIDKYVLMVEEMYKPYLDVLIDILKKNNIEYKLENIC